MRIRRDCTTDLVVDGLCGWRRSQRLVDPSSGVKSHGLRGLALGPETLWKHTLLIIEILKDKKQTKIFFLNKTGKLPCFSFSSGAAWCWTGVDPAYLCTATLQLCRRHKSSQECKIRLQLIYSSSQTPAVTPLGWWNLDCICSLWGASCN